MTKAEVEKIKDIFLGEENKKVRNNLAELLQIDEWKEKQAIERTRRLRPDLLDQE